MNKTYSFILFLFVYVSSYAQNTSFNKLYFENRFDQIKSEIGEDILTSFKAKDFSVTEIPAGSILVKVLGKDNPNTTNRVFVCHPDQIAGRSKEEIIRILALPYSNEVIRIQKIKVNETIIAPSGIIAGATWEVRNNEKWPIFHSENDYNGRSILRGGAAQIILLPEHYSKISFSEPEPFNPSSNGGYDPNPPPPPIKKQIPPINVEIQAKSQKYEVDKVIDKYHRLPGGVLIESEGVLPKQPKSIKFDTNRSAFLIDGTYWYYPELTNEEISIIFQHVYFGIDTRLGAVRSDNIVGIPMDSPLAKSFSDLDQTLASIFFGFNTRGDDFPSKYSPKEYVNPNTYNLEKLRNSWYASEPKGIDFFLKFGNVQFLYSSNLLIANEISIDVIFCNVENNLDGSETVKATFVENLNPAESFAIRTFVNNFKFYSQNMPLLGHLTKIAQLTAFLKATKTSAISNTNFDELQLLYFKRVKLQQDFPTSEISINPNCELWKQYKSFIDSSEYILSHPSINGKKRISLTYHCLVKSYLIKDYALIQKYRKRILDLINYSIATGQNLDFLGMRNATPIEFVNLIEKYCTNPNQIAKDNIDNESIKYHQHIISENPFDFLQYLYLLDKLIMLNNIEEAKSIYAKGLPYLESGAKNNNVIAAYVIGKFEYTLNDDFIKSSKYLKLSGTNSSAFELGKIYLSKGDGSNAKFWLLTAYSNGGSEASDTLSKLVLSSANKDTASVIELLKYNAKYGSKFAIVVLSKYFRDKNLREAAEYTHKAANLGDEESILLIDNLKRKRGHWNLTLIICFFASTGLLLFYYFIEIRNKTISINKVIYSIFIYVVLNLMFILFLDPSNLELELAKTREKIIIFLLLLVPVFLALIFFKLFKLVKQKIS